MTRGMAQCKQVLEGVDEGSVSEESDEAAELREQEAAFNLVNACEAQDFSFTLTPDQQPDEAWEAATVRTHSDSHDESALGHWLEEPQSLHKGQTAKRLSLLGKIAAQKVGREYIDKKVAEERVKAWVEDPATENTPKEKSEASPGSLLTPGGRPHERQETLWGVQMLQESGRLSNKIQEGRQLLCEQREQVPDLVTPEMEAEALR